MTNLHSPEFCLLLFLVLLPPTLPLVTSLPVLQLTIPAAVAECLAASAILARITLKSGATSTARIADLAELGSELISTLLELGMMPTGPAMHSLD